MDEHEPLRLLDDPALAATLREDLTHAKDVCEHEGEADAAFARFTRTVAVADAGWAFSKITLWVVAGLALIGVVVGSVIATRPEQHEVTPVAPTRPDPTPAVAETAPPEPTPAPAPEPEAPVAARRTRPEAARPAAVTVTPEESPLALLERETLMMSEQRREAQSGDARRSLEIARSSAREFPSGHFRVEREAWSIVALHRLGAADQVHTRGTRFLEQHPRAPQAEMIRRLVAAP